MPRKASEDIEVGDVLFLWTPEGAPRRVTEIRPYRGTLGPSTTAGWRTAEWAAVPGAHRAGGATLIPGEVWETA